MRPGDGYPHSRLKALACVSCHSPPIHTPSLFSDFKNSPKEIKVKEGPLGFLSLEVLVLYLETQKASLVMETWPYSF